MAIQRLTVIWAMINTGIQIGQVSKIKSGKNTKFNHSSSTIVKAYTIADTI